MRKIFVILVLFLIAKHCYNQIYVGTNFNIVANLPIDKRMVVNQYSDLLNIYWLYDGLLVFVKNENSYYYYNNNTWYKLIDNTSLVNYSELNISSIMPNSSWGFMFFIPRKIIGVNFFDINNNNLFLRYNFDGNPASYLYVYNDGNVPINNIKIVIFYGQ